MRFRALIVAVLGLAIAIGTLASIQALDATKQAIVAGTPEAAPSPVMVDILTSGKVHELFVHSETWAGFKGMPPLKMLIDPAAAWVMFVIVTVTFYTMRYRLKHSFAAVGLACLVGAMLPYTMGVIALTENAAVGPWSKTMLASVLYGSVACTAFAATNFFRVHAVRSKFLKQLEQNKEILKKKVA